MDKFPLKKKSNFCRPPDTSREVHIISGFSEKRWKDLLCHTSTHGLLFCNWSDEIHDSIYIIIQVTYTDSRSVKHWLSLLALLFDA
jgi:hypothetical protein